jgi:patatin-like phospholipase/acyl hydrolase
MSDLPVVVANNPRVVTTVSAIAGAHSDDHITSDSETGTHTDYVPLGAADCTPDVNYTCLVHDTNSTPDNIYTAHKVTANIINRSNNCTEPRYYDNSYTQSVTYDNNMGSHNNTTESSSSYDNNVPTESSYDNNIDPANVMQQQQQAVCAPVL